MLSHSCTLQFHNMNFLILILNLPPLLSRYLNLSFQLPHELCPIMVGLIDIFLGDAQIMEYRLVSLSVPELVINVIIMVLAKNDVLLGDVPERLKLRDYRLPFHSLPFELLLLLNRDLLD